MNLDQAVADAIHFFYDIIENDKKVMDVDVQKLDLYIERHIRTLHYYICDALSMDLGVAIIEDGSAERMTSFLLTMGVSVNPDTLYSICKRILENLGMETKKIVDIKYVIPVINEDGVVVSTLPEPGRKDGSLWYIKMKIDCSNLFT